MAPEMLRCECVTEAADVYSYGVVLWEVLTGLPPWESYSPMQVGGWAQLGAGGRLFKRAGWGAGAGEGHRRGALLSPQVCCGVASALHAALARALVGNLAST